MAQNINRVGETKENKYGSKMTIIEYNNYNDITVEFENGYITKSCYAYFKNKSIKSPYCKTICGVGYFGQGNYVANTIQYDYWRSMLLRCYDTKSLKNNPTYEDKYVCEEWHNFQTFSEWFDENYYEVENEKMCLDKDILYKNNKVYSPDTCIIVPQRINSLFTKRQNCRGEYPIGVSYHKNIGKFLATCSIYVDNKQKNNYLGYHETPVKAFNVYKEFKEDYIKKVANEYKDKIPIKLYQAMINYKVEIDD